MENTKETPENQKQQNEPGNDKKALRRTVEAYIEVETAKLGRTPTLDELKTSLLGEPEEKHEPLTESIVPFENEESSQSNVDEYPSVVDYKVFHGMSTPKGGDESQKSPDKFNILYYFDPKTKGYYDTQTASWSQDKPNLVDHLPCRPMLMDRNERGEIDDIFQSILHGVMDPTSFQMLKSRGAVSPNMEKLYGLVSKLVEKKAALEGLEKSVDVPVTQEVLETAPTQELPVVPTEEPRIVEPKLGPEAVQELFKGAFDASLNDIRRIVNEELDKRLAPTNQFAQVVPDEQATSQS